MAVYIKEDDQKEKGNTLTDERKREKKSQPTTKVAGVGGGSFENEIKQQQDQ